MILTIIGRHLPTEGGIGVDFIAFWSASKALLTGVEHVIDQPDAFHVFEQHATGLRFSEALPWLYPPHMLFVVYPLAALPFQASLAAWLLVGGALYAAAVAAAYGRWIPGLVGAIAFPPFVMNVHHGQNGFLTAALLTFGLVVLPRRPVLAGVAFGLLTIKPQLGIALPIALVAGRHWKAIGAACVTSAVVCGAATVRFGADAWLRMLAGMSWMQDVLRGPRLLTELQSPFAALRVAGYPLEDALLGHAITGIVILVVLYRVWRSDAEYELKSAALLFGTAIVTPYFYDYDAVILAPAFALVARHASRHGWLPWEPILLLVIAPVLLFSKAIATNTGVLPAPLCTLVLLGLVLRRIRTSARLSPTPAPAVALS